jgi:hypothetical protein
MLIDRGADVNARKEAGFPLMIALERGYTGFADVVRSYGATE